MEVVWLQVVRPLKVLARKLFPLNVETTNWFHHLRQKHTIETTWICRHMRRSSWLYVTQKLKKKQTMIIASLEKTVDGN